tara:strand:- start:272 stop:499 length:228 start_codon:yes stop_codon:yes gene_type:complete
MKKNRTLYSRLKPEYMELLISNPKGLDFSLKLAKQSLKEKEFFINLSVSDLDRLQALLMEDVTNNNISKFFVNYV